MRGLTLVLLLAVAGANSVDSNVVAPNPNDGIAQKEVDTSMVLDNQFSERLADVNTGSNTHDSSSLSPKERSTSGSAELSQQEREFGKFHADSTALSYSEFKAKFYTAKTQVD
jgi:hypothetical protein